ncbi:hypothetical protein RN001_007149 [Aquatica leii]|uniref:Ammonium transporter AmtB-like domain-containing protein n=1 Tax=Aquatica leii TaxID=1421715 RepID=A0AAN7QI56_9COLE|nr:hypothetical protein RN001_007149 [Aquatica leii]
MSYSNFTNATDYEDTTVILDKALSITPRNVEHSVFVYTGLVLMVRAGFVLVQIASIPSSNVFLIIYQNIIDIALSIASFGSVGYVIAFGDDIKGIIGYKRFFSFVSPTEIHNAIIGFSASLITMGIITTILCGRVNTLGYCLVIFVLSGLVQPAVIHWVWHSDGWLYSKEFLSTDVSFRDYSGGLIVHVFGGTVSLIAALFFGRRLMLLSNISELSIGVESPGSSFVGYIFIIVGLMGFSITSFSYEKKHFVEGFSGIVVLNNISGMCGGILVVIFLQHVIRQEAINYWNVLRCIQGGVAGIVAISPGVNVYTPEIAFGAAAVSSLAFYYVSLCIYRKTSIEDYCNVIAIHLVCGIIGLFFLPLVDNSEYFTSQSFNYRLVHSLWQLVSTLTVFFLLVVVCTNLFYGLLLCKYMRNELEQNDHERGLLAIENQERDKSFLDRLFVTTRFSPYVEPGPSSRDPTRIKTKEKHAPTKDENAKKTNEALTSVSNRKLRYAYTIAISDSSFIEEKHFHCGDHAPKLNEVKTPNKMPSCYNLHRTSKSSNLCYDHCVMKTNCFEHNVEC